jgi:nucleotide-binding universal stress UspA family protein
MFQHAMIAVDLDSHGPLLECAPDLVTWGVGKITLVHAIKVGYAQGPGLDQEQRHREMLDGRADTLRAQGLTVETDVSTAGDMGAALAAKATQAGADLLVVGKGVHDVSVALAGRGARVDVMHVSTPEDAARSAEWPSMARAALAEVNRRISAAGGTGEVVLEQGDPRDRILTTAAERNVSLLIVGKASHGKSGSLAMGSTARVLSKQAGRPVLMVPSQ